MRLKESNVTTESYELQQPEHIVSLATSSHWKSRMVKMAFIPITIFCG